MYTIFFLKLNITINNMWQKRVMLFRFLSLIFISSVFLFMFTQGAAAQSFTRNSDQDFNTLDTNNTDSQGIWSDGTTMWIADFNDRKMYAYTMSTKARDVSKDFVTLATVDDDVVTPRGIWSDGTTMWVVGAVDHKVYAYITPKPPSFNPATVGNRSYIKDSAITALTLPEATGGTGTLSYSLTATTDSGTLSSDNLPSGLSFNTETRRLSGTPTHVGVYTMTWAVTDSTTSESNVITFEIVVAHSHCDGTETQ